MCGHVTEANDLGAEMTLGCSSAVDEFVRCEARENDFWIGERGVIETLLRNLQVTEGAEDWFLRASGGAVVS